MIDKVKVANDLLAQFKLTEDIDQSPCLMDNGDLCMTLSALPSLRFFSALAKAFEIPIEAISTSADLEVSRSTYDSMSFLRIWINTREQR